MPEEQINLQKIARNNLNFSQFIEAAAYAEKNPQRFLKNEQINQNRAQTLFQEIATCATCKESPVCNFPRSIKVGRVKNALDAVNNGKEVVCPAGKKVS